MPDLPDPRTAHPRPPFPPQAQRLPGQDWRLDPAPDHGELSYAGSGRLAGLGTIVTGADSGIGRAVALAFAREGADVVVGHLPAEARDADATARLVTAAGRKAVLAPLDLGEPAAAGQLVALARSEFGRLDVVVNNAAFQVRRESIEEIPDEEWDATLRTNLTAMFRLCRAAVPLLRPGSSIINVSSIQAVHPSASLLAYATTKGGIVTFSRALAASLVERGIRVNVVAPGPVWTPLVVATSSAEDNATFGQQAPLGRPAQPAELAGAFVYLASAAASYVTGAEIAVTGGEPFP